MFKSDYSSFKQKWQKHTRQDLFSKVHIVEEFKQKWPYNKNAYPYTSLIENYGIGGGPVKLITNY